MAIDTVRTNVAIKELISLSRCTLTRAWTTQCPNCSRRVRSSWQTSWGQILSSLTESISGLKSGKVNIPTSLSALRVLKIFREGTVFHGKFDHWEVRSTIALPFLNSFYGRNEYILEASLSRNVYTNTKRKNRRFSINHFLKISPFFSVWKKWSMFEDFF